MKRILVNDMDAFMLGLMGALVAVGIVLHVWGRVERGLRAFDDWGGRDA